MRKLEFGTGAIIDLDQVVAVEPTGGDSAWRCYIVRLAGNIAIEVYEERRDMNYCMSRNNFVAAWTNEEAHK